MVSRFLESINGLFSSRTTTPQPLLETSATTDLDNELEHLDLDNELEHLDLDTEIETEGQRSSSKSKINNAVKPTKSVLFESGLFRSSEVSVTEGQEYGQQVRPVTRRSTGNHGFSDVPLLSVKSRERSGSKLEQIPCEISSRGQLPFGPKKETINVDSYSAFPTTVSASSSSGRVVSAEEKLIYGMSEMQEFVPRPTSTPEFLELKMMVSSQKSLKDQEVKKKAESKANLKQDSDVNRTRRSSTAPKQGSYTAPSRRAVSASSKYSSIHQPVEEVRRSNSSSSDTENKKFGGNKKFKPLASQKSSSSILQHLNDSVNAIILEEDAEFRDKYSQWITSIFHSQLTSMKTKLTNEFHQRLEELHEEKDTEILILHERYQSKLQDFEGTSNKFQKWVDTLEEENRQLAENKDSIIEELQMQLEEADQNFQLQLEKQQTHLKAEAEQEKLELVNRHGESLKKLLESRGRQDPLVKSQMESLHRLVSSLKSENTELKRTLKETSTHQSTKLDSIESDNQFDALSKTIEELRKRLHETEREKSAISELHADEIGLLKKHSEQANIDMAKQLQNAEDANQNLKQKHDREIKDLKMNMLNQETKYNKTFLELKRKYGYKIENLTKIIDKIQSDLTD